MISKIMTGLLFAVAVWFGVHKYQDYFQNPWTRDALIRAHVIEVTPRVTGPITKIHISDEEFVEAGQLLFEIDPSQYLAALRSAKAKLAQSKASLEKARIQLARNEALELKTPGTVPLMTLNNLQQDLEVASANVDAAAAQVNSAQLDLEFTKIRASKSGYITNFNLSEGAHLVANQPVVALVEDESFWIEGFFKETEIAAIKRGDEAVIRLMGDSTVELKGRVTSIGRGIAQTDGSQSVDMLPQVNPNFEWIRLAQRVPIKIEIANQPSQMDLIVGTSASVVVHTGD
ncbi:HlyD family secretion protein [Paraferrimonas sedimenticola]|uniref:Hemolysin D n=1 Tax=Paraferrimonas sedimenticola TaxID=375674 RepID=A0AA37VVM1_9GAMM|nr:HlyD family secretion protein [Paraferrimonas sedimenticola]GLP96146.1 hemolysin D [Paraferrimonas sedimenticola]